MLGIVKNDKISNVKKTKHCYLPFLLQQLLSPICVWPKLFFNANAYVSDPNYTFEFTTFLSEFLPLPYAKYC